MTADNFTSVLDGLRQLQPFRVFTVELHGGRRFEVDHPGALVVRDGVAAFLAPGGVPIWFDQPGGDQTTCAQAGETASRSQTIQSQRIRTMHTSLVVERHGRPVEQPEQDDQAEEPAEGAAHLLT